MKRTANRPLMVLFALLVSAAFAGPAHAAPRAKQSAEDHYQKGMKAYTLGKFPDAIAEFERAYELRSEPIFLYNIAQSHRQNNDPARAIFFYRRYLEAEPGAKNRADIEQRIKDMQSQLNAKSENAPAPAPAPQPIVVVAPPMPQPVASEPVPVVQAQPAPPAASPGRSLRIAGITVGVLGVAGVAAGIVFGVHATSLHDEAVKPGSVYDDSKYQSSKSFRTLEWVSLGVGGAAIITGGVLYYLGATAKSSGHPVAIVPVVGPGIGGAALSGSF
jgi:tetratricopeptide (TPR) repeat protein